MAILGHGSDLTLAPTAASLAPRVGGTVQGALDRLRRGGFQSVQLDATLRGIRPRELSQRARRDLSATIARLGLRLAGLDLFIPHRHYIDAEHLDRAMSATLDAVTLAADLGRVPLSVALPIGEMTEDSRAALIEAADGHGVALAVHDEGELDALLAWLNEVDQPCVGAALDPAALLTRSKDPDAAVHRLGKRLFVARLDDVTRDAARCPIGSGELDVVRYRVALDLAASRRGPVVLDLRGLSDPAAAAAVAAGRWEDSAFTL